MFICVFFCLVCNNVAGSIPTWLFWFIFGANWCCCGGDYVGVGGLGVLVVFVLTWMGWCGFLF